ncbi:MAG TPA: hypothetical protein VN736_15170 [Candidatus Limnocylindrales bacterium]|nr:hypothetical protein [Candidatus Limnocylindrales bacterium]
MPKQVLTEEIILAAIDGLAARRDKITDQIEELRAMLPGSKTAGSTITGAAPKKRHFSPEAIERMRAAQQRRWGKVKGEAAVPSATSVPAKRKRKLSAAGRKAISEAAKKRWAEAKKAQSPAAKKSAPVRKKAGRKAAKKAPAAAASTAQTAG